MISGAGDDVAAGLRSRDRQVELRCFACGRAWPADGYRIARCGGCGGVLECVVDPRTWADVEPESELPPTQWRYAGRLPAVTQPLTLAEGATPLKPAHRLIDGRGELWVKDETVNPSGSFKDRMSSFALSWAVEHGASRVVCASTGNAAASAAAYAAAAGLRCLVTVPEATAVGKLAQVMAYGAQVVRVAGTYSDAYALAAELERLDGAVNLTTTYRNPYAVCGLTTIGFELIAQLDFVPDRIYVPTGAGPLVRAVDRAYRDALAVGLVATRPRLIAVQASGCAPIVQAFQAGADQVAPWAVPETRARGIADPLQGYSDEAELTLESVRSSGGHAVAVPDELIVQAADRLARGAGIYAEFAGAAGLAGLYADLVTRQSDGARSVVLVTGAGWKDAEERDPPGQVLRFDPARDEVADLVRQWRDQSVDITSEPTPRKVEDQ